jgi:hypothetical protein
LAEIWTGTAIWKTKEEVSERGNNLSEEAGAGEGILRYLETSTLSILLFCLFIRQQVASFPEK